MKSPLTHFILALSTSAIAFASYGAWYATIVHKSDAVANLERQIKMSEEIETRVASARALLAQTASDEALIRDHFVSETGVVAFIDELEARGRAQNAVVSILSVSTGGASSSGTPTSGQGRPASPTSSQGGRSALILVASLKGTFDAVMRTLGSIEYAPYDLSIATLSLVQDDQNNWRADLKLTVGSTNVATIKNTL